MMLYERNNVEYFELVSDFGKLFCHVAGRPEHVDTLRSHRTHRRYYLRRRARELFAATYRGRILIIRCSVTAAFMLTGCFRVFLSYGLRDVSSMIAGELRYIVK
jgi:hypothetical protein